MAEKQPKGCVTTSKDVDRGDAQFDRIKAAVLVLLEAMRDAGAVDGSVAKITPVGSSCCVIIATGDSAAQWSELHDMWERGELTENTDGQ